LVFPLTGAVELIFSDIDDKQYTVAKMQLLSTNFKRIDGKFVWIGHNILATKVIENGECSLQDFDTAA